MGWTETEPESRSKQLLHTMVSKLGFLAIASLTAACAIAATALVSGAESKKAYAALILGLMAWAAFHYKYPKEVFLFGWLFTLTYNRQYFVFRSLTETSGMQAPYFIVADVFLLLLFLTWFYEVAILKLPSKPLGGRLWPWYLPFASACLLSIWAADRVDWTLFEMIRVLKVGLILWYARYNLRRREWWISATAIGCAVTAQSVLGILEVTFKKTGVLWLLGQSSEEQIIPEGFREENFYGFRRATATMNHPPNLACYLLLTIPIFVALALTHPNPRWRTACAGVSVLGLACLGCTMSRWPWAVMVVILAVLVVGLVSLRSLALKPALAILLLAGLVGSGTGLVMSDVIYKRITGDLNQSVEEREKGNRAALDMLVDNNLILGVGLNNYRVHMLKYQPEAAWTVENEAFAIDSHLRFIAGPLNGFLLVLSESGVLGLTMFAVYLLGVAFVAVRAIRVTSGYVRAAMFGLALGFLAVIVQQAVDYSYWVDPVLYTATMIVGMLNCARSVQDPAPTPVSA